MLRINNNKLCAERKGKQMNNEIMRTQTKHVVARHVTRPRVKGSVRIGEEGRLTPLAHPFCFEGH